jgi:hypothetical protein
VTVNFGVAGNVAGASAITILGRLAKVTATGTIGMANIAEGTVSGVLTLTKTGTTARTATFPDAAITVAGQGIDNAFSVGQTFANRIAIGGGALSTLGAVYIGGMTGVTSTNAIGFFLNAAYPSTATASCRGAQFSVTTAASTVVAEATGFLCASITKGSGGTITRCQSADLTDQTNGTNNCALLISNAYTYTGNWAIRSESANASYLAGSLTVAGVVTAPDGTAAAPGLRTTTYAHGMHSIGATSVGIDVAGALVLTVGATASSFASGTVLTVANTTDATTTSDGSVRLSGGLSVAKSVVIGGTAGNSINVANATGSLKINGTKVVGAQGAAVADATDATSVIARLNDLLSRLRTHGLIAT